MCGCLLPEMYSVCMCVCLSLEIYSVSLLHRVNVRSRLKGRCVHKSVCVSVSVIVYECVCVSE